MYKSYAHRVASHITDKLFTHFTHGAQQILQASQQIVPVDDGELIGGGMLTEEKTNTELQIVIAYGTDPVSAKYAVVQHENPAYNHAPGKQYKFLEQPFDQLAPGLIQSFRI